MGSRTWEAFRITILLSPAEHHSQPGLSRRDAMETGYSTRIGFVLIQAADLSAKHAQAPRPVPAGPLSRQFGRGSGPCGIRSPGGVGVML